MRFDEASAVYAEFGPFYVGLQFASANLAQFLEGRTPALWPGSKIFQRHRLQIFPNKLSLPPQSVAVIFREMIFVQLHSQIYQRLLRKWIAANQWNCICIALQQFVRKNNQPRILSCIFHCSKPHLPINSALIRRYEWRTTFWISRFREEFIFLPICSIIWTFNDDFISDRKSVV